MSSVLFISEPGVREAAEFSLGCAVTCLSSQPLHCSSLLRLPSVSRSTLFVSLAAHPSVCAGLQFGQTCCWLSVHLTFPHRLGVVGVFHFMARFSHLACLCKSRHGLFFSSSQHVFPLLSTSSCALLLHYTVARTTGFFGPADVPLHIFTLPFLLISAGSCTHPPSVSAKRLIGQQRSFCLRV